MPLNPVEWALGNLTVVLTGALVLVLVAWAYDAYEDADDRREAAEGFVGNAKEATGGWLNVALVGLVGTLGGLSTAGMTAAEGVGMVVSYVPELPVFAGGVLTVGLGALGLSGVIEIVWWHFALGGLLVLLVGVAWRLQE